MFTVMVNGSNATGWALAKSSFAGGIARERLNCKLNPGGSKGSGCGPRKKKPGRRETWKKYDGAKLEVYYKHLKSGVGVISANLVLPKSMGRFKKTSEGYKSLGRIKRETEKEAEDQKKALADNEKELKKTHEHLAAAGKDLKKTQADLDASSKKLSKSQSELDESRKSLEDSAKKLDKITSFARGKGRCSLIEMAAAPVISALCLFPEDFVARSVAGA